MAETLTPRLCENGGKVTMTITGRAQPALHAIYGDHGYDVGELGAYFQRINAAWRIVIVLAAFRTGGRDVANRFIQRDENDLDELARRRAFLYGDREDVNRELGRRAAEVVRSQPLTFERIHLNSPLDITLAVQAAGVPE